VISNVSPGLLDDRCAIVNITKSGCSNGSRSIAPSIVALRLPTMPMTETARTINATISNANAFLTGCSVARMDPWIYQIF
jgi:hypothetical protein